MTETEPAYFRCDTTIFVKIQSLQDLDAFDVGQYIGAKIAKMVLETNRQHATLAAGEMILEAGEITTTLKDKKPRGRFSDDRDE